MVTEELTLSRGHIEAIAGSLQQLVLSAPESRQRRQLAECAARLQAVARTIAADAPMPIGRTQRVLDAAKDAADRLGQMQRSSVLLLGLLLTKPGVTRASADIAAAIGISQQSVRVFAFHLRRWLEEQGYADALRSQWGMGYMLAPRPALALLESEPALVQLAAAIETAWPCGANRPG